MLAYLAAYNKAVADDSILVLPFDMTNLSVHEECFQKVLKKYGKVRLVRRSEQRGVSKFFVGLS